MSDTTTLWEFPEEGMTENALNWLRMFGGRERTFRETDTMTLYMEQHVGKVLVEVSDE